MDVGFGVRVFPGRSVLHTLSFLVGGSRRKRIAWSRGIRSVHERLPAGTTASAIAKAHEGAKLESPCRDPGVRASLKGWGRRLAKPQRQSGALTADVLAVIRSKTDAEAQGAVVPITPAAMDALSAIRPEGVAGEVRVFGLSEYQIARRVKAIARAAGLADWEFFSSHSGRVGMARRMAQNGAPTHEIKRQGRWKQGGGMVGRYTRGESAGSALRYL